MGLFTSNKRRQGNSDGRPGTAPFGSGRRLHSDLSLRDCVEAQCQEPVTSQQGAQAAEHFVATHAQLADWTSAVDPLRTALQQLAEWGAQDE